MLETGLGGRLDAVTTCEPCATAITSIGLDHSEYLGDTLPVIAREKAGILKPGVPCFVGRLPPEADAEVERAAEAVGAPLFRLGRDFAPPPFPVALAGAHQIDNAAIAAQLARAAARHIGKSIDDRALARALADVRWPGPLRAGGGRPAVRRRAQRRRRAGAGGGGRRRSRRGRRVVLLVSIVDGKDPEAMLAALAPVAAAIVVTRSDNPRALPPATLSATAGRFVPESPPSTMPSRRSKRRAGARARAGWSWCAARCSWSGCCGRACWARRSIRCRRRTRYWGAVKEFLICRDELRAAKPQHVHGMP